MSTVWRNPCWRRPSSTAAGHDPRELRIEHRRHQRDGHVVAADVLGPARPAALTAPAGQVRMQAPQPMHWSTMRIDLCCRMRIALVGQTRRQAAQPVQRSSSKRTYRVE